MSSIKKMYSNYFNFKDRTSRKDFWIAMLIIYIIVMIFSIITINNINADILLLLELVLFYIPLFSMIVRRLHDINKSGWYIFIAFVPLVGFILYMVYLCSPSIDENNNYGIKL